MKLLLICALAGCTSHLVDSSALQVECASNAECAAGTTCNVALARCLGPDADGTPPVLELVSAADSTRVTVRFDEALNADDAKSLSHYTLSGAGPFGPLIAVDVTLAADGRSVTLLTSEQWPQAAYHLSVDGIRDLIGNPATAAADFAGFGVADTAPPALLSPTDGSVVSLIKESPTLPLVGDLRMPAPGDEEPIALVWTSRQGALGYTVQVSSRADFSSFESADGTQNAPFEAHVDRLQSALAFPSSGTPLLKPITYWWRVRADSVADAFSPAQRFDALAGIVYVACPAGVTCNEEAGAGNFSNPLQSIVTALATAKVYARDRVHVASRMPTPAPITCANAYCEVVSLIDGVSLLGGYDTSFTEPRAPATHVTAIANTATVTLSINALQKPTVLDGFTLHGIKNVHTVAASSTSNAVTLSYCILESEGTAGGSSFDFPAALSIVSSDLTVSDCTLIGPKSNGISAGVVLNGTSKATFTHNMIAGGATPGESDGVLGHDTGSGVTFAENSITGGSFGVQSIGLALFERNDIHAGAASNGGGVRGSGRFLRNFIHTDVTGTSSTGADLGAGSVLVGNVVIARSAGSAAGVSISGTVAVANNTVGIQGSSLSRGIDVFSSVDGRTVVNNVLFSLNGNGSLFVLSGDGTLPTFQNNALAGFSTVGAVSADNTTTTLAQLFVASPSLPADFMLLDSAPAAARTGGQTFMPEILDYAGNPRTIPFSLGAFEKDF